MKTKAILFLVVTAVVTLSFTFISNRSEKKNSSEQSSVESISTEPVGGFGSQDKL